MRTRPLIPLVAVLAVVTLAVPAAAQAPADSLLPRSGSWGAEVTFGPSFDVALLRFTRPRAAWLLGASFDVAHVYQERPYPGGSPDTAYNVGNVSLRLGRRWLGAGGGRLRALSGAGLSGFFQRYSPGQHLWGAGIYGELGGAYFFTPHLSLGASGLLSASYTREADRVTIGTPTGGLERRTLHSDYWRLSGNAARLSAGVHF